jgi:hypothetical protein
VARGTIQAFLAKILVLLRDQLLNEKNRGDCDEDAFHWNEDLDAC